MMKEMPVSYHRILMRLEKQEQRLLCRRTFSPFSAQLATLRTRIPRTVQFNLERAFEKAFSLLFGPDGTRFLEHTYAKGKLEAQAHRWELPLSPAQARKHLSELNRSAALTASLETAAAGVEGAVLGVLGIGLPDIPILLAWLLRSLYQNAARCGFSYESPAERVYLLLVLQGALTEGEQQREFSRRTDRLGRALDHGWETEYNLEVEMRVASALLADRLLLVKFIQGMPVVGVIGGAANLSLSSAVNKYGTLKYKKRFLERKVRGL